MRLEDAERLFGLRNEQESVDNVRFGRHVRMGLSDSSDLRELKESLRLLKDALRGSQDLERRGADLERQMKRIYQLIEGAECGSVVHDASNANKAIRELTKSITGLIRSNEDGIAQYEED